MQQLMLISAEEIPCGMIEIGACQKFQEQQQLLHSE